MITLSLNLKILTFNFLVLIDAYKQADGIRIDGFRILVDMERGRTVSSFRPRRLGGGLGNTRKDKLPKLLLPKAYVLNINPSFQN